MLEELSSFDFYDLNDIEINDMIDKSNAEVYKGKCDGKDIAIKEYYIEEGEFNYDFYNELNIGESVNSERLLKIYGFSHDPSNNKYYLLMEYINSGNLFNYINNSKYYTNVMNRFNKTKGITNPYLYEDKKSGNAWIYNIDINNKINIVTSILKAVKSMYDSNIIHGDLKTANLGVHNEKNNRYIKIIDYGTCYHNTNSIHLFHTIGTNGYCAPEQEHIDKNKFLNHKSDIYSLGVIIIEVWVGDIWKYSTKGENSGRNSVLYSLRRIKKENESLEKLLRKCISLDYNKRPDIYKLYNDFKKLYSYVDVLSQSENQM